MQTRRLASRITLVTMTALALSCASAPTPVLYPNEKLEEVGTDAAQADIEACRTMADDSGAHRDPGKASGVATSAVKGGAVGGAAGAAAGAIAGNAGRGAAMGAAGAAAGSAMRAIFSAPKVSQLHKNFVNRCLTKRGYEPIGWN